MKPTGVLINLGRGKTLDEVALVEGASLCSPCQKFHQTLELLIHLVQCYAAHLTSSEVDHRGVYNMQITRYFSQFEIILFMHCSCCTAGHLPQQCDPHFAKTIP